jgi:hypothetical protein
MQRELKKLITVNLTNLVACFITLIIRIYINVTKGHENHAHETSGYFVFGAIVLCFGILNALIGFSLAIYERITGQNSEEKMVLYQRFNYIHLVLNFICFIVFAIFLMFEFIAWSGALHVDNRVHNNMRLISIVLLLLIQLCHGLCTLWNRILAWSPKYRFSRVALFFSSFIQIAISTVSLIINHRVHFLYPVIAPGGGVPLWCYRSSQASASYTLLLGILGISLTLMYVKRKNRLSKFRNGIRCIFNIASMIGIVFVLASMIILSLYDTMRYDKRMSPNVNTLIYADTVLSILRCTLLILAFKSLHTLSKVSQYGRNGLIVERIQLSKQSNVYVKHWAAGIDACSQTADGMIGDAALQLMIAYETGPLENVTSVVLRIGRPARRIPISIDQWDDTEAIVFLTIIHHYDTTVSAPFHEYWRTMLQRTLGSQNCMPCFRPLVLRVGLLGYQWPFRAGIFFITPHDDDVSRAADVLQSVIEWNEMQKSNLRCNVLLLPALINEPVARATYSAGFFPLPLPPTHLLDLRPHRGKTWNEYMKTLKRGNRRPYLQQFLKKGGIIEELHDLSRADVAKIVCDQWANIARVRKEKKEPPTLVRPSVRFIAAMGHTMMESYRSVVFLRFNNEVIASSVIFKFPNKLLTTDIQGLTHEKARPIKAYFVMLQWVIKEALDKEFDFVDFGPTTPGPKTDLGCIQVPLKAAGYSGNPILAFGIKKAGGIVDSVHMKKENQDQIDLKPARHEDSCVEAQVNTLATRTRLEVDIVPTVHVTSSSSIVTEVQHFSKKKYSPSGFLEQVNVNTPLPGNNTNTEELGVMINVSDQTALYLAENEEMEKEERFVSDDTDGARQNLENSTSLIQETIYEDFSTTNVGIVVDELHFHHLLVEKNNSGMHYDIEDETYQNPGENISST